MQYPEILMEGELSGVYLHSKVEFQQLEEKGLVLRRHCEQRWNKRMYTAPGTPQQLECGMGVMS